MFAGMKDEMILVVRRELFDRLGAFQGLDFEVDRYLPALLDRANNFFTPRPPAETDPWPLIWKPPTAPMKSLSSRMLVCWMMLASKTFPPTKTRSKRYPSSKTESWLAAVLSPAMIDSLEPEAARIAVSLSDMKVNCWCQFTIIRSPLISVMAQALGKAFVSLCAVSVGSTCWNDAILSASVAFSAASSPLVSVAPTVEQSFAPPSARNATDQPAGSVGGVTPGAEVAPNEKAGKGFLNHLGRASQDANPELSRLALKLATGAGKTTVMAMLIAWQSVNAVRRPQSRRFTRGFLVVTPGITIKDRLRVLQPNDPRMSGDRLAGSDDCIDTGRGLAADLDEAKLAPLKQPRPHLREITADDVRVHFQL